MTLDLSSYSSVPIEMLVSYLPEWFAANTGDDPDESTYRKVLSAFADALARPVGAIPVFGETMWLPEATRSHPRLVWAVPAPSIPDDLVIQWNLPDYTQGAGRIESQGEFLLAHSPVYALSSDGYIYLRGLAQIEENASPDEDGNILLSYAPLVQDEPVWLEVDGRWEPVHTLPGVVDWDNGILHLGPIGTGGSVNVLYSTRSRASDLPVMINGEMVTATLHDMWNAYDEAALLVSLARIPSEDNPALASRIKASYRLLQKSDEELAKSLVGHELGLVDMVSWDGTSTLTLTDLGVTNVAFVTVLELDKRRLVKNETLVPDTEGKVFTSAAASWDEGWMLFINGTMATKKTYPALDYDEIQETGRVNFSAEVVGDVTATYSAAQYTSTIDPITGEAVIAPTGNTPRGSYTVLYTREIKAHSTLDPDFLSRLIGSNGLPTELYIKIAEAAAAASPILIGRTDWGDGAHWFDDTETAPPLSYLPVPIK